MSISLDAGVTSRHQSNGWCFTHSLSFFLWVQLLPQVNIPTVKLKGSGHHLKTALPFNPVSGCHFVAAVPVNPSSFIHLICWSCQLFLPWSSRWHLGTQLFMTWLFPSCIGVLLSARQQSPMRARRQPVVCNALPCGTFEWVVLIVLLESLQRGICQPCTTRT